MKSADAPPAATAPPSPVSVPPIVLLGVFATLLADMAAEAEQAGQSTGLFKLTATLMASTIEKRGLEDAARFAARISGLDIVDGPRAVTP